MGAASLSAYADKGADSASAVLCASAVKAVVVDLSALTAAPQISLDIFYENVIMFMEENCLSIHLPVNQS